MAAWIAEHLGPDVPLHFTAFHPDFKMLDVPPTPPRTLTRAREIARRHGLRYVYTGNVHDRAGSSTYCPGCGAAGRRARLVRARRVPPHGRRPRAGSAARRSPAASTAGRDVGCPPPAGVAGRRVRRSVHGRGDRRGRARRDGAGAPGRRGRALLPERAERLRAHRPASCSTAPVRRRATPPVHAEGDHRPPRRLPLLGPGRRHGVRRARSGPGHRPPGDHRRARPLLARSAGWPSPAPRPSPHRSVRSPSTTTPAGRRSPLPGVVVDDRAHAGEHSLEVHLPFVAGRARRRVRAAAPGRTVGGGVLADVLDALWGGPETAVVDQHRPQPLPRRARRPRARPPHGGDDLPARRPRPDAACGAAAVAGCCSPPAAPARRATARPAQLGRHVRRSGTSRRLRGLRLRRPSRSGDRARSRRRARLRRAQRLPRAGAPGHDDAPAVPQPPDGQGRHRGGRHPAHRGRPHPRRRRVGRVLPPPDERRPPRRLPRVRVARHRARSAGCARPRCATRASSSTSTSAGSPGSCASSASTRGATATSTTPPSPRSARRSTASCSPATAACSSGGRSPMACSCAPIGRSTRSSTCCAASTSAGRLAPFTRCLRCGGPLAAVRKADVLDRLEPLTRQHYDDFARCGSCGQVYWKGSHHRRLEELVDSITAGGDPRPCPSPGPVDLDVGT